MNERFLSYLKESGNAVFSFYREHPFFSLTPSELMEGSFVYFERGGKRLRPAICRMAAGALGGQKAEFAAVPCALALELYHNWTLVHDDMIDHDDLRRGKSAVHKLVKDLFVKDYASAGEYGYDTALLAGDALHSAAVYYLCRLSDSGEVAPEVTLKILSLLEGEYGPRLISGEAVDTKNGILRNHNFCLPSEEEVLSMMAGKTGALFAISALSGALIGQNRADISPEAQALADFAEDCGIAFQLQDDILGITSTEEKLGKPIGSDIREGKPTLILIHSYQNANEEEKAFLRRTVGCPCSEGDLLKARNILLERGGKDYTVAKANKLLDSARSKLQAIADGPHRQIFDYWCDFMLLREM